jgi:hypothetical protein
MFDNFNPQPKKHHAKKKNLPTTTQRKYWDKITQLGCVVKNHECAGRITINHCFTGAGGRKDHDKVIPLCWNHHLSKEFGIDGRGKYSKKTWQEHYGTELQLLETFIKKYNLDIDI